MFLYYRGNSTSLAYYIIFLCRLYLLIIIIEVIYQVSVSIGQHPQGDDPAPPPPPPPPPPVGQLSEGEI